MKALNQNPSELVNDTTEIANWKRSLDFLWLEITPKCNLNCIHCYADSTPFNPLESKMTFQNWVSVMKESFELGCRKIQFIGGEPTIHPEFLNFVKIAKKIGYEFIEVYTNGTVLSDDMFSIFQEHDVNIAFSFYSSNADTHDKITLGKGSYLKTDKNIRKALQLGLKIRVGVIEMEENENQTSNTVNYLKSLGIKNIRIDGKREIGRGRENGKDTNPMSQLCGACWKGKLAVDASGNIFPCVFSRANIIGSVEEGLINILKKESLKQFREDVFQLNHNHNSCSPPDCGPSSECTPQGDCSPSNEYRPPAELKKEILNCHPGEGTDCNPDFTCNPDTGDCAPDHKPGVLVLATTCGPNDCSPGSECVPQGDCSPSSGY
jgi:radical SAM protein with 4Fe4S-binding SPASM domain